MYPWSHAAIGYLAYSAVVRLRHGRSPTGRAALALLLGTQFPDLIDKPANWWFGIFDGRAIAHSLLVLVPLCLLVYRLASRRGRGDLGVAFGVGVVTHLFGDAWLAVLSLAPREGAPYLLWPVWPAPTYPADGPADHVQIVLDGAGAAAGVGPAEAIGAAGPLPVLVLGTAAVLWALDGFPGLATARRAAASLVATDDRR